MTILLNHKIIQRVKNYHAFEGIKLTRRLTNTMMEIGSDRIEFYLISFDFTNQI